MKYKFLAILGFLSISLCFSQKQSLKISDFASWNRIENRQISYNGQYVAYEVNRQKGDGMLIIYQVESKQSDTIQHGTKPRFSALSNYVVFNIRIPADTLRKLKLAKTNKDKMPKEALGVFNLSTRKLTKIEHVKSYQLAEEKSNWLTYMQEIKTSAKKDTTTQKNDSVPAKKVKPVAKKEKQQLVVWEPVTDKKFTFNQVDSFAVATKGIQIAYLAKLNDSTRLRTLVLFQPETQHSDTILKDSLTIQKLTFDEAGLQLAFLTSADTASAKNYALNYYNLKKNVLTKAVDSLTVGIQKNHAPSINAEIAFSRDGSKLYLGTAPKVKPAKKDSVLDEDKPKLDLWSYTDQIIQPRQLKLLPLKKKQTYQAVYRINDKKFIQIADTTIENIRYFDFRNAEIALGIDRKKYEKNTTWSNRSLNDYYKIDLKTGTKTLIVQAKNNLYLSPKAQYALYFDYADSIYYAIDLHKMTKTALTSKIYFPFYDELNDVPTDPEPYGVAGWTADDKYVLIYDRFDIWKIDPTGKQTPMNLTNGRKETMRYRYEMLNPEINYIPEKILLSTFNETTNAEAFAELNLNKPNLPQKLIGGDFKLSMIQKAKNADKVIWSLQSTSVFPDIQISDLTFKQALKISNANPQQVSYIWPKVEKVSWVSFAGDTLKGLLYKPENFDAQKKYPLMVYFYEKNSDTEHRYNYPQPSRSIISIPFYVSNEYLVFVPDISYRTGQPGKDAYNAIVSGVRNLTETRKYIDAKHIALQGQSWGGYQIAYLVTQTDMFAAAMAGAPVSNMTSAYGGIRWGTGMSRMFQYEETQSRIGGTLWEKPLHFIENSPLFHAPNVKTPLLIMANDNDGAVPWYQGIEYFMALYRLGKPVWMINYNGMDHNIEDKYWANRVDLSTRMFGFFNHYLKGMPAPEWMTKGIPATDKGEKLGY